MSKITSLSDVANLQNETAAVATINTNSDRIETAFANTLSLDGSTPNSMLADLDMNSNEIINIGDLDMNGHKITGLDAAVDDDEPIIYSQLQDVIGLSLGAPFVTAISFVIDAGAIPMTTGVKGDLMVPFDATINSVELLGDQSGSIVVDIWKDTYTNFPPTVADTITSSAPPTISSATKSVDTTLSGWTTTISEGDIFRFNVNSVSGIGRVTVTLKVTKR